VIVFFAQMEKIVDWLTPLRQTAAQGIIEERLTPIVLHAPEDTIALTRRTEYQSYVQQANLHLKLRPPALIAWMTTTPLAAKNTAHQYPLGFQVLQKVTSLFVRTRLPLTGAISPARHVQMGSCVQEELDTV